MSNKSHTVMSYRKWKRVYKPIDDISNIDMDNLDEHFVWTNCIFANEVECTVNGFHYSGYDSISITEVAWNDGDNIRCYPDKLDYVIERIEYHLSMFRYVTLRRGLRKLKSYFSKGV